MSKTKSLGTDEEVGDTLTNTVRRIGLDLIMCIGRK